jgi:AAA+ ATPase superfamily predicted ATPase
MRFYDRTTELSELSEIRRQAFGDHSRFTVVTGRRRIGKTSLILKSLEQANPVYLFVGKSSEGVLCDRFVKEIAEKTGIYIPPETNTLRSLFTTFLRSASTTPIDLVIDEFQELGNINPSFFSDLQDLWDRNKETTHINLIVSGSVFTLMNKIFMGAKEPLFGRADNTLRISAFAPSTLKEILKDYSPDYTNKDLLALYAITGGVPKYIELFCDNKALAFTKALKFAVRENSPLLEEGKSLLIEEFGRDYAIYFSILTAVSRGMNTQNEIESFVGKSNLGGHLKRLVEDYGLLAHLRPIFAKPNSQTVKYEIRDQFLRFWFRYIEHNRPLVEIKGFERLQKAVLDDFDTYSGKPLEDYFKEKLAESGDFLQIGSYWEAKQRENREIDIVAIKADEKKAALVAEVKRDSKEFRSTLLHEKARHLAQKEIRGYTIEERCLSLEDM